MNVVAYRMVNGDEILGRDVVQDTNNGTITLSKIRHLIVQRTAEGLGVTLMPWIFSDIDTDVTINGAHIMASFEPSAETLSSYLQQTTGIALASV